MPTHCSAWRPWPCWLRLCLSAPHRREELVTHFEHGSKQTFFVTDFETVFLFEFRVSPGSYVRQNVDGTGSLHYVSNRAEITVLDFFSGDELATGKGSFNLSLIYTTTGPGDRIVVRGMGDMVDSETGEPLDLYLRAVIIKDEFKGYEFSLEPK